MYHMPRPKKPITPVGQAALDDLGEVRLDSFYRRRAATINRARQEDVPWQAIADELGLTLNGTQRLPYVDSSWNRARGLEIVSHVPS